MTAKKPRPRMWIAPAVMMVLMLLDAPAAQAAAPTITSFNPTSGPVGTSVQINGTGFQDGTDVSAVTFNGVAATFTVTSDVLITATVPLGASDGIIEVTDSEATAVSPSNFDVIPLVIVLPPTEPAATPIFQVRCFTTHTQQVDPIVAPGLVSAHEHEFFGNMTTGADSTYNSMVGQPTSCSTVADTAGYWTPTLFDGQGNYVQAKSLLIYYRGAAGQPTQAFPPDLRMISSMVIFPAPDPHNLIIKFPGCWDGVHTDSADHMSHMAFDRGGDCPASHPVRVPEITEVFRYPVELDSSFRLSSDILAGTGMASTAHADFWNTWVQAGLEDLVGGCLNSSTSCGRIDLE